jgi:hypothetical protein
MDGVSRRSVISITFGALAGILAGCRPLLTSRLPANADRRLIETTRATKLDVLTRYAVASAQHPTWAPQLDIFAAHHRAHLVTLSSTFPAPTPAPTLTLTSPSPRYSRALLAAAEQRLADQRVDDLAGASPGLARLLASIGGCEAAHASQLRSLKLPQ